MSPSSILLVGCGEMAVSYARVLKALDTPFDVIGRRPEACATFAEKTGVMPRPGGVAATGGRLPQQTAIVAVNIDQLAAVVQQLLEAGVRNILVEKPGGLNAAEISATAGLAAPSGARIFVAYNRRFYASVQKARELIAADGGATSFFFEFTEWSHLITDLPLSPVVKQEWLLANTSHLCDLAFYLGGFPAQLTAHSSGALSWHPRGAQFTGCGVSRTGALFAYHSNWESAGRWGVEICTARRRLHLRPLESLNEQIRGELALKPVELADQPDREFKPGLLAQTRCFLDGAGEEAGLLPLAIHSANVADVYSQMTPAAPTNPRA
jgi:predicted dehydrogenase